MNENDLTEEQQEKRKKRLEIQKKYREKNQDKLNEKNREYRKNNKEIVKESNRKWAENNRDKVNAKQKRYTQKHSEVIKKKQYEWYRNNKEKVKEFSLLRKYNLSLEQYRKMLDTQEHKCLLCKISAKDTASKYLVVDHCHNTGKIRGLLCNPCNTAIGLLKENIETIKNVIQYLTESSHLTGSADHTTLSE